MPPRYLRKGTTKLKPCSEFTVEACDIAPADQCCGALPCSLCLELETYADGISYGTATFGGSSWTGTVGGLAFVSYWEVPILPDIIPKPTLDANSVGMSFAAIVEATYTMGSPVTEPGRNANETQVVKSVEAFNIAKSQVGQEAYYAVMGVNPSHFALVNRPVEMVSWDDANLFCFKLGALPAEIAMGRTYRLPTEAEWEYACRSGATGAYFFGADPADLPTYGWFTDNSVGQTQNRAYKTPNSAGLYDTHGNVWEWTSENGEASGFVRGGGWDSTAAECRSASRRVTVPSTKANNLGFRVVMMQGPPVPIPQIGECEYVVTLDAEEVYRATCYEGASCRDPGGSVGVTIGYDEGTLTWAKHEPRPLALIVDPDTGCNDFFCGTCRCTCDCLCVTITEVGIVTGRGEICTASYPCDAPIWEGAVGYYDLSIALGRDQYTGECIITLTADGDEQEPVFVTGCDDMSASVTLYDGTIISVACKDCSNCSGTVVYPCECRRDGDIWVATHSAGTSPCAITNPPVSYVTPNTVPEAKRAWNVGDCVFGAPITYLITAFPPFCTNPNTSHFIAFVQKMTSGTTPFIDNAQVQENEWYAVVYDDSTFDIIGISYEYSTCCKNETPENAATSHLIWVQWDNLPFGGGLEYTIRMTNTNAVTAYGTC